jgi:ABC-type antimicrobial peptide transport system permease subunit
VNVKKTIPPQVAQRLLLRFLREDLAEEVQGDLEEKFYVTLKAKSQFRANVNYWYQVLNYLRPFAVQKIKSGNLNQFAMFQNYIKIGYRNLIRNKGYSFINIGGLAVGMAIAMLIGLWIYDEGSFNMYHANYSRIAQVMQHQTFNGRRNTGVGVARPMEKALRTIYGNDFQYISIGTWTSNNILSYGERKVSLSGNFFQADFPEMVSLQMIKGSRSGLKDPSSIMLSASGAKALFGDEDPMNQSIRIGGDTDVKVTGVYEDLPYNTTFKELKFIAHWELFVNAENWVKQAEDDWGNNSFQLFVAVAPNADMDYVSTKIRKVKFDNAKDAQEFNPEIFLHPMANWHLRSEWKNGMNVGGRIQLVWLFGLIGTFVLLLACINFMNLSTARSEKRAKEVGIRMAIGSLRSQLINQFLSESFLVVMLSFVTALGFVAISIPWFNELADKKLVLVWSAPEFWLASTMFILFTSLVAGSYPALYLSSFQPVKVLKGSFRTGRFSALPRKVLVIVQYTVSIALIIGTLIVYQQIQFSKNRPIGYDSNGLVMIEMKSPDFYGKFDVLKNELTNIGAIVEMAQSSSPLTSVWSNSGGFNWEGKDPALQDIFGTIWITHEYGKTVGWEIIEGRDISRDFSGDSSAVILNEKAVEYMGVKDPVGMEISWNDKKFNVVGVVKDIVMDSPYHPVNQAVYFLGYYNVNWINLKLNPAKSSGESLSRIESVFKKHIPSAPFDYKFVDEVYARKFSAEERIGKLTSVFAGLAIFISCLGIFGLASFTAEQRTKEIGIRKVLGASVSNLWRMLSKDFVILVFIACLISIPLAYYVLHDWLQRYEYRTEISGWAMALSGLSALVITLLTVSYQAIKAALANPVRSLRSE